MKFSKVFRRVSLLVLGCVALTFTSCGEKPSADANSDEGEISGLNPSSENTDNTTKITAAANPCTDTLTPNLNDDTKSDSVMNRDFSKVTVDQDTNGYLTVTYTFNETPAMWENDRFAIAIFDKTLGNSTDSKAFDSYSYNNASSYLSFSKAPDYYGVYAAKDGSIADDLECSVKFKQNTTTWAYSPKNNETEVTFTIPLNAIDTDCDVGDVLQIVAFVSAYDYNTLGKNGVYMVDACPAQAVTFTTSSDLADTDYSNARDKVVVDFTGSIEYKVDTTFTEKEPENTGVITYSETLYFGTLNSASEAFVKLTITETIPEIVDGLKLIYTVNENDALTENVSWITFCSDEDWGNSTKLVDSWDTAFSATNTEFTVEVTDEEIIDAFLSNGFYYKTDSNTYTGTLTIKYAPKNSASE